MGINRDAATLHLRAAWWSERARETPEAVLLATLCRGVGVPVGTPFPDEHLAMIIDRTGILPTGEGMPLGIVASELLGMRLGRTSLHGYIEYCSSKSCLPTRGPGTTAGGAK